MKTKNGKEVTPEILLQLVKKALPGIKITESEEKTLLSMLAEFVDTEYMHPGKDVCDFLGIERRYNKTEINNAIFDFVSGEDTVDLLGKSD